MRALHDLAAHELSAAYGRTEGYSPVEVTRAALARIEAWEKSINAMYVVAAAGALVMAAASEKRWRRRKPLSALDGVPITIKDNIAVQGIPAPVGTAAGDMTPSAHDAPAGGAGPGGGLRGVGQDDDAGFRHAGVGRVQASAAESAQSLEALAQSAGWRLPGAGAAIVAGYGPLALGTDIGGSVRLPAAYNGIVGFEPSLGRVPIYPPYLGRVTGPLTRNVTDTALLMAELSKPDARDYMALPYQEIDWIGSLKGGLKGKKLGLLLEAGVELKSQPAVRRAIASASKAFARAGAVVEPVTPFLTRDMLVGLDRFFQARLLAEYQSLPAKRKSRCCRSSPPGVGVPRSSPPSMRRVRWARSF